MATKTLEYKIKVVNEGGEIVEKTAKSFKDLQASQSSLQSELQKADFGSPKFKELQGALKTTSGAIEDAKNKTTPLSERLKEMPGITGQVAQSFGGLNQTMKVLAANPIGAIIAALGLIFVALKDALSKNDGAMDKLNKSMAKLSGLLDPVIALVQELLGFLIDGFVKAADAITAVVALFGDMGAQAAAAAEESARLNKELDDIEDAERGIAVERAKQNKLIAEAREKLSDANVPLKERKEALAQVRKSEESLASREVELAKRRLKMLKDQQALEKQRGEDNLETTKAIEQATINLANTETDLAAKKRLFNKQEKALTKEAEQQQKEAHDKYMAQQKEKQEALKSARQLEKGYLLNAIQDERDKSLQTIENARLEQRGQIDALKVGLAEKNKLKKMADEDAARQSKAVMEKYAQEALDFQQQQSLKLIQNEDERNKAALKLANDKEVERINKLKITEEERTKLLLNQEQILKNGLAAIDDKTKKDNIAKEISNINTLIELEGLKEAKTEEQRQIQMENIKKLLNDRMNLELQNAELTDNQRMLIKAKYADEEKKITDAVAENNKKKAQEQIMAEAAKVGAIGDSLSQLSDLLGKDTEAGKMAAVAAATINTYKGITEIIAAKTVLPEPAGSIAKAIQIATTIATGIAAVNKIKSTDTTVPKVKAADGMIVGFGGAREDNIPAMLSNGESVINARSTSMFRPILSVLNQLGGGRRFADGGISNVSPEIQTNISLQDTLSNISTRPIKTYVLSTDVETAVQLDRQIKNRSTI